MRWTTCSAERQAILGICHAARAARVEEKQRRLRPDARWAEWAAMAAGRFVLRRISAASADSILRPGAFPRQGIFLRASERSPGSVWLGRWRGRLPTFAHFSK